MYSYVTCMNQILESLHVQTAIWNGQNYFLIAKVKNCALLLTLSIQRCYLEYNKDWQHPI